MSAEASSARPTINMTMYTVMILTHCSVTHTTASSVTIFRWDNDNQINADRLLVVSRTYSDEREQDVVELYRSDMGRSHRILL